MKIPEGWPTEEMIEEGRESMRDDGFDSDVAGETDLKSIFIRMLAAAPIPPEQEYSRSIVPVDLAYLQYIEDDSRKLNKLREAAEEAVLHHFGRLNGKTASTSECRKEEAMKNLRAALEKK